MVELGEVCEVVSGATPKREVADYWNGDIDWVTPKDLTNLEGRYIDEAPEKISEAGYKSCSTHLVPPGSVLLSSRAPIGHLAITQRPVCTNQGFKNFIPGPKVDAEYLYWALKRDVPKLQAMGTGSTFKEISKAQVAKFKIPLPPLPTQRRIAAVLDKAQALVANDKRTLALYDQLAKSLFLEMFGDPVRNERGWEVVELGSVVEDIVGGESTGGDERPLLDGEWGVLKISAVTSGVFDPSEYKVADIAKLKRDPVVPRRGDLLFSRANTREMVGATCVVDQDCTNLFLPDKLWRIDLDRTRTNAWFMHYLLHHEAFRASTLGSVATGTSGSMLNISKAKLLQLRLPMPDPDIQGRFYDAITALEKEKIITRRSLRQSEDLFGSLLQRAFSGGI